MKLAIGVAVLVLAPFHVAAGDRPTVTGVGTGEVSVKPEYVRLSGLIHERGSRVDVLLRSLLDRGIEIEKKLEAMGATAGSIRTDPPRLVSAQGGEQQQLQAALQRLKQIKQGEQGDEMVALLRITVDFPLTGADIVEQLARAQEYRRKLTDLLRPPGDGEEEDDASGMANMLQMITGEQSKPGEVAVIYACRISDEQQQQAARMAFERATAAAKRLAGAAGQSVGALLSIVHTKNPERGAHDISDYNLMQILSRIGGGEGDPAELLGDRVRPLNHRTTVETTFELKVP